MFYVYRCTTDKLEHHLNRVVEAGDTVFSVHHQGGRDWLLVCRQGGEPSVAAEIARLQGGGQ